MHTCTPHTALVTRNHLKNIGFPVLLWPAKSPDLNPITHLFSLVACVEVFTAGTSPEPLAPLQQDPSQCVHAYRLSQELIVASSSCTSMNAVGAFTWLNPFFF